MSRNRKRKGRHVQVDLFARAQRELAKGNAKTALKGAVQCYREDASPARRQLLEKAFVERVEQLHRVKQSSEARAVLARLLEFDPTSAEVREKIPNLQVILGDSSADANGVFEKNAALLVEQTDRAVLDAREAVPDYAGTKSFVEQVRAALAAVEDGDDAGAAELLGEIPRTSPLCDWKLFVRGLSAFYESDSERMQENWRRLDATRPAYRIAQTLLVASGELQCEDAPIDVTSPLRRLKLQLRDDPATETFEEAAEHWREDDQSGFFRVYRRLRQRFAKTHGSLLEKIVDFVWKRAVRVGDEDALDRLAQIGPAPALDPNWNRARALMAEHPEQSSSAPVRNYWAAYANDLESLAALRKEERMIAEGLVYSRLGLRFVEYGEDCVGSSPFADPDVDEAHRFFVDAIGFWEESIRRCSRLGAAYKGLAVLHEKMKSPEKSVEVLQRFVQQEPDDYFARHWLATYYLKQDDPRESAPHVEVVGRLKPRDSQTISLRWQQRLAMVRSLTKGRKFDLARQELEEAAKSPPPIIKPFTFDILRAAIEFKAKRMESAQRHLNAALAFVGETTVVWMQMSCTAARYSLPRDIKKDFDDRFKKEIKKKPTSQTAGLLAEYLTAFKMADVNYTGRATQERLVIDYLKRAKRVRWDEEALFNVCNFLSLVPKQKALWKRLIMKGVKKFSDSARLHFNAGQFEMEGGPFECDIGKAERHMNRVLELAEESTEPLDQQMIDGAKRAVGILRDMKKQRASPFLSPFGSPFGSPFCDDDDEDDEDDCDTDGFFMPLFGDDSEEEEDECDCPKCRRRREGGASPGRLDAATLEEFKQLLPRSVIRQMESVAANLGMSLDEMLEDVIKKGESGDTPNDSTGSNEQSGRRSRRAKKKRNKAKR